MRLFKICSVLTGLMLASLIIQSCDLIQSTQYQSFKNPYTKQTNKAFDEIADVVFGHIDKRLATRRKAKSLGSLTRAELMRYANEGYTKWAKENDANVEVFRAGADLALVRKVARKQKGKRTSEQIEDRVDSLLQSADLSEKQRTYILQLPDIVEKVENLNNVQQRLQRFDASVAEKLGEEDSKAVLKMSALMLGSVNFITTHGKVLSILTSMLEENARQKWASYQSKRKGVSTPRIKVKCPECGEMDPPESDDYFQSGDTFRAAFNTSLALATAFGSGGS